MSNILDSPIYMHYFDRELRNSVKANLSDDYLNDLTETALLLTLNNLYVANSLLWESREYFPNTVKYILELEKFQEIILLSNYPTIDEFVVSRRQLYIKEKEKYPMYFSDELNDKPWGKHIIMLNDSTTELLENKMKNFLNGKPDMEFITVFGNYSLVVKMNEIIEKALANRNGQAITFSLFQQYITKEEEKKIELESMIKKVISLLYTKRYLNSLDGQIVTGIEGLYFFDILCSNSVLFDFNIHKLILQSLGLLTKGKLSLEQRIISVIQIKRDQLYREFLIELRGFVEGISNSIKSLNVDKGLVKLRILNEIRSVLHENSTTNYESAFQLNYAYTRLLSINSKLLNNQLFKEGYDKMRKLSERKKILIVTATLTELKILLKVVDDKGIQRSRFTSGKHTYFTLSQLGKNDVYVFRTEMGSVGSNSSILSINEAINTINPDYIIMAGIAFGLKKGKQKIGDILVSRQLWSYEQAKVTETETISRGDKITASGLLLDRFSTSSLDWNKTKVEFGLIVTGEKLVNSKPFVEGLLKSEPEAIGGEMEGAGLMSVCQSVKKDWILIKSICDWGYKKTGDYQEEAAANVMEYVIDTLTNYFD